MHAKVHERERERHVAPEREREPRTRARERARTRECDVAGCASYRGTRMIWKGRGSRVTSCHSAVPSTYPPPVYEMSADRWGHRFEVKK